MPRRFRPPFLREDAVEQLGPTDLEEELEVIEFKHLADEDFKSLIETLGNVDKVFSKSKILKPVSPSTVLVHSYSVFGRSVNCQPTTKKVSLPTANTPRRRRKTTQS